MLKSHKYNKKIECGVDEVGRGCLAGPVVAAAVILPSDFQNDILNDSKQLTDKKREKLFPIIQKAAISYGIGVIDNMKIDEVNILNATFLAMHEAISKLSITPELLLIDGNRFKPYQNIDFECIIKGDGEYMSIAAASVLAKVYRDNLMRELAKTHPYYDWEHNMGYPTKKHRKGIQEFGVTDLHRRSFRLLPEQLELFVGLENEAEKGNNF